MRQRTFAELEHDAKKRRTRREVFLEKMDGLIPWERLVERVRPHYPVAGRGRRPYDLEAMVRVHCVQLFYNLSDPLMEDTLYEAESVRRFCGLSLSGALPDETTILKFRHLLEEHCLGGVLFEEIKSHLEARGHRMTPGTIVDATVVEAPTSVKNANGERDAEMGHTRKGKQWHFGMKAHIGVDAETGLTHGLSVSGANESDVEHAHEVLRGDEAVVHTDAGYRGIEKREENAGRKTRAERPSGKGGAGAVEEVERGTKWRVAMGHGKRKHLDKGSRKARAEKAKARVRAKVEHPFLYVKRHFGYSKVRYRGLAKNRERIALLLGFTNLLIAGRHAPG